MLAIVSEVGLSQREFEIKKVADFFIKNCGFYGLIKMQRNLSEVRGYVSGYLLAVGQGLVGREHLRAHQVQTLKIHFPSL